MQKIACLLTLLLCAQGASAQEAPGTGKVVDETWKALQGANVVAYGPEGKVLSYAISGEDGTFLLKKTDGMQRLSVSFLGYKTVNLSAGEFRDGQRIQMEPGGFQL